MKKLFGLVIIIVIVALLCVAAFKISTEPTESTNVPSTEVTEPTDISTPTEDADNTTTDAPNVVVIPQSTDEPTSTNVPEVIVTTPTDSNDSNPEVVPAPTKETDVTTTPEVVVIPTDEETDESEVIDDTTSTASTMELHQINVGCADAYLLRAGDFNIVIDGGLSESRTKVLNYIKNAGVSEIDVYIATHWHGDHVQNMTAILKEFGTSETIVFGPSKNHSASVSIPSGKGQYKQMVDSDTYNFNGINIKCMGPYKLTNSGENNYDSLNFLVQFGEKRIFMTGDYVHDEVLDSYREELTNVDVYKMAHHGLKVSDFSGSPAVLPTLNPDIILVPANSNGPASNLFSKLGISAKVYNNKSGNIVLTTDGTEITVSTEK